MGVSEDMVPLNPARFRTSFCHENSHSGGYIPQSVCVFNIVMFWSPNILKSPTIQQIVPIKRNWPSPDQVTSTRIFCTAGPWGVSSVAAYQDRHTLERVPPGDATQVLPSYIFLWCLSDGVCLMVSAWLIWCAMREALASKPIWKGINIINR